MKFYTFKDFSLKRVFRQFNKDHDIGRLEHKLSGYNLYGGDFTKGTANKDSYTLERDYISRRQMLEDAVNKGWLDKEALNALPNTYYIHKDNGKTINVKMNQSANHTNIHRNNGHNIYLNTAYGFDHEDAHGYLETRPDYLYDKQSRNATDSHETPELQAWEAVTDGKAIENQNQWAKKNGGVFDTPQDYITRYNNQYDQLRNNEAISYYNNPVYRQWRQNNLNADYFKDAKEYENFLNYAPKDTLFEMIEPARYNFLKKMHDSGKSFREVMGFRVRPENFTGV
jgi:hypothetical protein